jgi:hypothetical protein
VASASSGPDNSPTMETTDSSGTAGKNFMIG